MTLGDVIGDARKISQKTPRKRTATGIAPLILAFKSASPIWPK